MSTDLKTPASSSNNKLESQNESSEIANEIMEEVLTDVLEEISRKTNELESATMHKETLKQALEEMLKVCELPKPRTDYSHIIDAWKWDKPAKPSTPDILIKNLV